MVKYISKIADQIQLFYFYHHLILLSYSTPRHHFAQVLCKIFISKFSRHYQDIGDTYMLGVSGCLFSTGGRNVNVKSRGLLCYSIDVCIAINDSIIPYPLVISYGVVELDTWWPHQMETFSALLAISAGNSPVPGEFPAQRPVMRSFAVFFDLRLNKRLCKQSWGWWFETLSRPLWRHRNEPLYHRFGPPVGGKIHN